MLYIIRTEPQQPGIQSCISKTSAMGKNSYSFDFDIQFTSGQDNFYSTNLKSITMRYTEMKSVEFTKRTMIENEMIVIECFKCLNKSFDKMDPEMLKTSD